MLKKVIFLFHKIGMYIIPFLWIFSIYILPLHFVTILSWQINKKRCIISQLEYYFFKETFMGSGRKYFVPRRHRFILYFNFLLGLIYHYKKLTFLI